MFIFKYVLGLLVFLHFSPLISHSSRSFSAPPIKTHQNLSVLYFILLPCLIEISVSFDLKVEIRLGKTRVLNVLTFLLAYTCMFLHSPDCSHLSTIYKNIHFYIDDPEMSAYIAL